MAYQAVYKFEDLTTDYSGNNYTLSNQGTATQAPGILGNAVECGTGSNKALFRNDNIGIGGNDIRTYSVIARLNKTQATATNPYIFSHTKALANGGFYGVQYLVQAGSTVVTFDRSLVGPGNLQAAYVFTTNTTSWYHFVFSWDGSISRGYINGSLVATANAAGTSGAGYNDRFGVGCGFAPNIGNYGNVRADEMIVDRNVTWNNQKVKTHYSYYKGIF